MFATNAFRRVESALLAVRLFAGRPGVKPWLFAIAFAVFVVLAVISFRNLPDGVELRPLFVVAIALIGTPAIWLLNALEYRVMATAAGHRVSLDNAMQVSLAASLANFLPVPGGVAVRTAALKLEGSSLGSALSVNAIAGIIWLGATALLVGLALLTDLDLALRGLIVGAVGVAILGAAAAALRPRRPAWKRVFAELLAVEAATTLVAALRVALAFAAIGQSVSVAAAVTLAAAPVLAAAIGIFPAGLGLREALSAGLALTVQVPAAVAVAASAVERGSALLGMALYAPLVGLHLRKVAHRRDAAEALAASAELDAGRADLAAMPTGDGAMHDPERTAD